MGFNPIARAQQYYSELWKTVIRPPRDQYELCDLGARKFTLSNGKTYVRSDFEVVNERGENIVCSHHEPHRDYRPTEKLPCVVYLHGNCSSRLEALCALPYLLPLNITVVGFDFAGSGRSDGEWVTLGWREKQDLEAVINYLRETRRTYSIALWGRSMGAVTAMLYAKTDATIMGMVCDSPFANLRKLAEEIAGEFLPIRLPQILVSGVLNMLRNTILQKAEFDIDSLDLVSTAAECYVPVLLLTGDMDHFIKNHHARDLYNSYKGEKWLVEVSGDHNSPRTSRMMFSTALFFYNTLQCSQLFDQTHLSTQSEWFKLAENCAQLTVFSSPRLDSSNASILSEAGLFGPQPFFNMNNQAYDNADEVFALSPPPISIMGDQLLHVGPRSPLQGAAVALPNLRMQAPQMAAASFNAAESVFASASEDGAESSLPKSERGSNPASSSETN